MAEDGPIRWNDPATWPWVLYVAAALVLIGLAKDIWNRLRRMRAANWPIVDGRVELAVVIEPEYSNSGRREDYVADLEYSYSIAGIPYSGVYRRDHSTKHEADEFIRDLQNKAVTVHYNPAIPSRSSLLEADVNVMLQQRSPCPALQTFQPSNTVPQWVKPYLWAFVGLSCIGLVLSFWVHLGALMGRRVVPADYFMFLHLGIFVVWLPSVLVSQRLVGNMKRKDFWKVILRGSPEWMRYMVYGFFGYAIINFLLFIAVAPSGGHGANPPTVVWRGFSGHWMAFYSAAFAILYSAVRPEER